jgi:hypothetical protein
LARDGFAPLASFGSTELYKNSSSLISRSPLWRATDLRFTRDEKKVGSEPSLKSDQGSE